MVNYREQYAKYNKYFIDLAKTYGKRTEVRVGIELLLTLFTISFFAIFAIRPTVSIISQLLADINSQREVQKQLDTKIASLRKAQAVWAREQATISLLNQALPKNPQPENIAKQIEALAALHQVTLEGFSLGGVRLVGREEKTKVPTDQNKKGSDIAISLSVKGTHETTSAFLRDVENLRRIIIFSSFTFGTNKKEEEKDLLIVNLNGFVPYQTPN